MRLQGRTDWKMWKGVEVEGNWTGLNTLFIKEVVGEIPEGYEHYYVLKEALSDNLIKELMSRPDAKVTLEVPYGHIGKYIGYLMFDFVRVQMTIPNAFNAIRSFDNLEVRVDEVDKAFTTKSFKLTKTTSTYKKDYKEDVKIT